MLSSEDGKTTHRTQHEGTGNFLYLTVDPGYLSDIFRGVTSITAVEMFPTGMSRYRGVFTAGNMRRNALSASCTYVGELCYDKYYNQ